MATVGDARTSCIVLQRYDTTVIVLEGHLDRDGVSAVADDVHWTLGHCDDGVAVIDATRVEAVDAAGLQLLSDAESVAAAHDVQLTLRPSPAVRAVRDRVGG
jgi:anti-anti-sigma regulatory factor